MIRLMCLSSLLKRARAQDDGPAHHHKPFTLDIRALSLDACEKAFSTRPWTHSTTTLPLMGRQNTLSMEPGELMADNRKLQLEVYTHRVETHAFLFRAFYFPADHPLPFHVSPDASLVSRSLSLAARGPEASDLRRQAFQQQAQAAEGRRLRRERRRGAAAHRPSAGAREAREWRDARAARLPRE